MTLEEAKDIVSKKYADMDWVKVPTGMQMLDEAAELYAKSKWDEAQKQKLIAWEQMVEVSDSLEFENKKLRLELKELSEELARWESGERNTEQ